MQIRHGVTIAALGLAVVLAPATARADGYFVPFIGTTSGSAIETVRSDAERQLTFGATLGYMGGGVFGFELDLGLTPDFFGESAEFGDNNVTTLMGNVVIGVPFGGQSGGGVRPYGSGGIGLLKVRADGISGLFDVDSNDFGMNLGGGIMGFFSDHVGIRGDIRYFRNLTENQEDGRLDLDLGGFDFWRGTVGLALRF